MQESRTKDQQPAREQNIEAIVSYFESGIKKKAQCIGIELEHTIVTIEDEGPVSYSEEYGVRWLLEQMAEDYTQTTYDMRGDVLGLARECESITLEPAAQVELSAGPYEKLADANNRFLCFEKQLETLLTPHGKKALTLGYHPTQHARNLELIPKRRYSYMNLYLGNISPWGPRMMRGSASTQISIDYTSVDDCLRKLRLAYALVPILYLISDNSPYFEGEKRPHPLMRTEIWQHCDPNRCGTVPGIMNPDFSLRDYAEYVLDTPAILVPCELHEWCYAEETFGDIYYEKVMGQREVEHALSMLFNDVRLKSYIEIRPGDAMPIPYVIAYGAFIKGLFYNEDNLSLMDDLFEGVSADDINCAKAACTEHEYKAQVYGHPVTEIVDALMVAARRGLANQEASFLDPLSTLTAKRTTLAQKALL